MPKTHIIKIKGENEDLEVVFEDASEVVLELGASEVGEDLLPVRRVFEAAEVGFELSGEDLQGGRFPDPVCADEAENLPGPRHRKPVELEGVWAVAMSGVFVQVFGQVDDLNGLKRAFLHTDTATDAQLLRDVSNLGRRSDLDAKLA